MEKHNIRLTSSEIANLWTNYMGDSISICVFTYFLNHIDDLEIKRVLEHAIDLSRQHISKIAQIFREEGIPVPLGFTNEDVYPQAERLFSDSFYLQYVKHMTKGGLATYSAVLPNVFRNDIREYYMSCLSSTMELFNESTNLLLSKGLEVRSPYIAYPSRVEFVEKQSFLSGWLGEERPLTAIEITHLYANIQTNKLGEAFCLGFAQVAKQKEVKEYMHRGVEICKKHITLFTEYLQINSLPIPMTWDQEVTGSTDLPFSEKLMMFHVGLLSATGMGNYGVAMSLSPRRDLASMYGRLIPEVGKFAEDGTNISINRTSPYQGAYNPSRLPASFGWKWSSSPSVCGE
ncbi:DUF3231 family protein [Robertmurraya korlensis]|uniref:DUF3231 family protein n=1 Tax=Robertmurraya korlensis TaxID=519977 RepID=UPI000A01D568|nr:DUF3231 family protein [Robertmurraya korlensis]